MVVGAFDRRWWDDCWALSGTHRREIVVVLLGAALGWFLVALFWGAAPTYSLPVGFSVHLRERFSLPLQAKFLENARRSEVSKTGSKTEVGLELRINPMPC